MQMMCIDDNGLAVRVNEPGDDDAQQGTSGEGK
jgi:hypothetical protein